MVRSMVSIWVTAGSYRGALGLAAGGALALVLHLRKRRTGATAPAATAARDEEDW